MIVQIIGVFSIAFAVATLIMGFKKDEFPVDNFQAVAVYLIAAAICFK